MADTTTWIIVAAVVVAVIAIVSGSIVVGRRRHRLEQSVTGIDDHPAAPPTTDRSPAATEEAIGDRSELLHRARRGF
ncbi:hypothetical protein NY547_10565 [Cnuibacter physcomitrellae]|uniref:hypothetical protein n=1 Tax=Cnuibacter physcomitrellae TaxID=1619308 RepID=UPI002175A7FA|nr:hypothetical protein [Cnuibacter physcomitrellae]MCS5497679.1 hypothetical protein [Cnuibacter physcomitrellae]